MCSGFMACVWRTGRFLHGTRPTALSVTLARAGLLVPFRACCGAFLLLLLGSRVTAEGDVAADTLREQRQTLREAWTALVPDTRFAVVVLTKVADVDAFRWLLRLQNATVVFVEDAGGNETALLPLAPEPPEAATSSAYRVTVDPDLPRSLGFWGMSMQPDKARPLPVSQFPPSSSFSSSGFDLINISSLRYRSHRHQCCDVQALEKALYFLCVLVPRRCVGALAVGQAY